MVQSTISKRAVIEAREQTPSRNYHVNNRLTSRVRASHIVRTSPSGYTMRPAGKLSTQRRQRWKSSGVTF